MLAVAILKCADRTLHLIQALYLLNLKAKRIDVLPERTQLPSTHLLLLEYLISFMDTLYQTLTLNYRDT